MPASLHTTTEGYLIFATVKLLGYTAFTNMLNAGASVKRNAFAVGATRTAIGMAVGIVYYRSWQAFGYNVNDAFRYAYLLGLVPIRFLEWGLLLGIFYRPDIKDRGIATRAIVGGTVWSFVLDIPAALGYLFCGLSIC